MLCRHNFSRDGLEARLCRPTSSTAAVLPLARAAFDSIFHDGALYRSAMIVLGNLRDDRAERLALFERQLKSESLRRLSEAVDVVKARYGLGAVGAGAVGAGAILFLERKPDRSRDNSQARLSEQPECGESAKQQLGIPKLQIAV